MFGAAFYTKNCKFQRSTTSNFLKQSSGLVTTSSDDVIMDVGCGPGDVTTQLLIPAISNQFKKLYGIDHSPEMIDYAKTHNASDIRIEYLVIDIGAENGIKSMKEKINHIFSFYCFHWVKNQKQLYLNLYDMLMPGGDMLCKFGARSVITCVWGTFKLSDKWGHFLRDAHIPHFRQELSETISDLMHNLKNAGFSHIAAIEDKFFTYETDEDYRAAMQAVSPWLKYIPANLHSEIMDDYMVETRKYNEQFKILDKNATSRTFSFTDVEMFARKRL